MMRFRKNKDYSAKNENPEPLPNEKNQTNSLKQEMIDNLLKTQNNSNENPDSQIKISTKEIDNLGQEFNTDSKSDQQISLLTKKIGQTPQKTAIPKINFTSGNISYPILAEIGANEENVEILEKLSGPPIELLEKIPYEKLVVCPKHPNSLTVNVRFYCSKCNSMNIEKLYLVEHNKCGYIAERKKFVVSQQKITACPSCNQKIDDEGKELRIPAMWYVCNGCNEKFDDVTIKLYCRDFDHDFSPNQSETLEVYGYKLKNNEPEASVDTTTVFEKLTKILSEKGFNVEENASIKGKSGRYHHVDLFAKDDSNNSVCIFIKNSSKEIDNSEINSKIIQVLDTEPNIAILIGFASISEKAKSIATSYHVSIISSNDTNEIVTSTDKLLTDELAKLRENAPKP